MQIKCPTCGALVGTADINVERTIAKCHACSALFDFSDQLPPPPGGAREDAARGLQRRRAPVPMPARITVTEAPPSGTGSYREAPSADGGRLVIVRRWYHPYLFALIFFLVLWNGFLVFWYTDVGHVGGLAAALIMIFPLGHVAAGLFLTYFTIAGFVNKTTITVTDREMTLRHAPLPWRGNRTIPVRDLRQLYCEEEVSQGKNGTTRSYHLSAIIDGKKVRLLSSLPSPEHALFIEQKIEERLGIVDVEVGGEYRG